MNMDKAKEYIKREVKGGNHVGVSNILHFVAHSHAWKTLKELKEYVDDVKKEC